VRFHHLGIATRSLAKEVDSYSHLGYEPEGGEFQDDHQGIRGLFLAGGGPRLEILEPIEGSKTLEPILLRGLKCYHHAYEVEEMEVSMSALQEERALIVRAAAPAIAFGGRRVAFMMLQNRWMVELIDAKAA
jgi:methylmalonyl-CoA/ethylmalonyl-CoA epimerase